MQTQRHADTQRHRRAPTHTRRHTDAQMMHRPRNDRHRHGHSLPRLRSPPLPSQPMRCATSAATVSTTTPLPVVVPPLPPLPSAPRRCQSHAPLLSVVSFTDTTDAVVSCRWLCPPSTMTTVLSMPTHTRRHADTATCRHTATQTCTDTHTKTHRHTDDAATTQRQKQRRTQTS